MSQTKRPPHLRLVTTDEQPGVGENRSLEDLLSYFEERGEPMPRRAVFEIIAAVARAMDAASSRGEIHGGLHPSAIVIEPSGVVNVVGFGDFSSFSSEPDYVAPERLMGEKGHPSADVFSLGVILYQMLTLEPFGRIYIRISKHEQQMEEKIGAMHLSGISPAGASSVRILLRAMLAFIASDRPSAGRVVESMEQAVKSANDADLRALLCMFSN